MKKETMADRQRRNNAGVRIVQPVDRAQPRAGRRDRGEEDQGDGASPRVRRRGVAEDEGQLGNDRGADQNSAVC